MSNATQQTDNVSRGNIFSSEEISDSDTISYEISFDMNCVQSDSEEKCKADLLSNNPIALNYINEVTRDSRFKRNKFVYMFTRGVCSNYSIELAHY